MDHPVATVPPRAASASRPAPQPPPEGTASRVRTLIIGYALTLAGLLATFTMLLVTWELASTASWVEANPWPAAVAATTGWALAVVIWLHRRAWRPATIHSVTWVAPAALLAPLSGSTWLSPDGLVVWAPVTTVLAAAVVMATQPTVALPPARAPLSRPVGH